MDAEIGQTSTCLELALEGERLCKTGDFEAGVAFFEAAIKEGTDDMRTLSAIYSQLGNAYFYVGDYNKALNYHQKDLDIAKSMEDQVGEGKASGNLGNTLKMLGHFEEAVERCTTHLMISRELKDKIGEGRAMYNLGNVYHTKGKQMAKSGLRDPGEFPDDVKQCLVKAVHYYDQNLKLMREMGDKCAQGRACGNLGNTHYLLGNFGDAVTYHNERLRIAKDFGDKAAERRAHCNLGNAHIFLGEFDRAVENYLETLRLAQELKDRLVEAQACYSLGNTYTLLRDYPMAIEYHTRHLEIARELGDRAGENRAYWSLGNAHTALGNHNAALGFAQNHLKLSRDMGDASGENSAQNSISDLRKMIEQSLRAPIGAEAAPAASTAECEFKRPVTPKRSKKRNSMDNMELLKMTPNLLQDEAAQSNFHINLLCEKEQRVKDIRKESIATALSSSSQTVDKKEDSKDSFLDLLARFQGERMEEQRATFEPGENKENRHPLVNGPAKQSRQRRVPMNRSASNPGYPGMSNSNGIRPRSEQIEHQHTLPLGISASTSSSTTIGSDQCRDELFDLIAGFQAGRMDEQRAELPNLRSNSQASMSSAEPRDRCPSYAMGPGNVNNNHPRTLQRMATVQSENHPRASQARQMSLGGMPDDDFFEMIIRSQASRLEDQRSSLPLEPDSQQMAVNPSSLTLKRSSETPGLADSATSPEGASTVPDDDFFSLILRLQSGRIDDQRTPLPSTSRSKVNGCEDEPMPRQHSCSSGVGSRKSSTSSVENVKRTGRKLLLEK
ncbi:G-protein-signaling modulator 2 [Halotydeus destructor]|nr:G-protein-signaling modulator 2 [Halotydeus destructor]